MAKGGNQNLDVEALLRCLIFTTILKWSFLNDIFLKGKSEGSGFLIGFASYYAVYTYME